MKRYIACLLCLLLVTPVSAASIVHKFSDVEITHSATIADLKAKGPWVDVRAYGAVGDGIADDTTAIQAAIDTAKAYCVGASSHRHGAVVYFPKGEYKVTVSLDGTTAEAVSENLTFRGDGDRASLITAVLSSAGPVLDLTGQGRPRIIDLGIESRSASSAATAVVLFAENPSNSGYSNRYPIIERSFLYGSSPDIVATVVVYNADLLNINNSYIGNDTGTDGISAGPHVPTSVTSLYQTFGTRLDATQYNIIGSTVLGNPPVRIYGGTVLSTSSSYFARTVSGGADNAIFLFECDTYNGPSLYAHGIRVENQTTDNNIALLYAKGTTGAMWNIYITGETFLADTDGDFTESAYIRSNGSLINVYLFVTSDYKDSKLFDVAGSITGTVYGYSSHSAVGTVGGSIWGWNFNCEPNSIVTMMQSLTGKILGARSGILNGTPFFANYDNTSLVKKIRLNDTGDGFYFEDP
jgi:hypothetical protein